MIKPLNLAQEQKDKLLEMTQSLFPIPKYEFWWEYDMYGRGLKQDFNDVLCMKQKSNGIIEYHNIHWYEFCVEHLSKKVYTVNNEVMSGYENFVNNYRHTNTHPIDFLYKFFVILHKKL